MIQDRAARAPLIFIAAIVGMAGLFFARSVLAPVTFALFVVCIVAPLQAALQRKAPEWVAVLTTLLLTLATLVSLTLLIIWSFGLVAQWLTGNTARFQSLYGEALNWLDGHDLRLRSVLSGSLNPDWISGAARRLGGQGWRLLSFITIAFAFTVLGLLEVNSAAANISRLEDPGLRESLLRSASVISAKFRTYMVVRSQMSILTGVVVWAFALFAGMELATAWGVIAFVLNYIPFIGPLVATVFPSLFALAQFESWELALTIFASLNLIQFFIGSYLEPRIAGATLSASPFMVLLAVFFGAFLWGVAGAFLGVPILIAVLTLCEQRESTRWIAVLLSGGAHKAI